jgi:hypothetical protein
MLELVNVERVDKLPIKNTRIADRATEYTITAITVSVPVRTRTYRTLASRLDESWQVRNITRVEVDDSQWQTR